MGAMVFQITSLPIVYSTVYSGPNQRKHQSSASLAICAGNSPMTGEFPAQRASNAENVSIWWRHHEYITQHCGTSCGGWWVRLQPFSVACLHYSWTTLVSILSWIEMADFGICMFKYICIILIIFLLQCSPMGTLGNKLALVHVMTLHKEGVRLSRDRDCPVYKRTYASPGLNNGWLISSGVVASKLIAI